MNLDFITIMNLLGNPLYAIVFFVLTLWALVWKGFALYAAARHSQKVWFVLLLTMNTFGILEIAYLFYFQPKQQKPVAGEKPGSSGQSIDENR